MAVAATMPAAGRASGTPPDMAASVLPPGQVLPVLACGSSTGLDSGDPRWRKTVVEDVANGKVSAEAAGKLYGWSKV